MGLYRTLNRMLYTYVYICICIGGEEVGVMTFMSSYPSEKWHALNISGFIWYYSSLIYYSNVIELELCSFSFLTLLSILSLIAGFIRSGKKMGSRTSGTRQSLLLLLLQRHLNLTFCLLLISQIIVNTCLSEFFYQLDHVPCIRQSQYGHGFSWE